MKSVHIIYIILGMILITACPKQQSDRPEFPPFDTANTGDEIGEALESDSMIFTESPSPVQFDELVNQDGSIDNLPGDMEGSQVPAHLLAGDGITIFNSSNRHRLIFIVGTTVENADTVTIMPREIWVSPNYSNTPLISIASKRGLKEYSLTRGRKYMLFWNKGEKVWDLTAINVGDDDL